MQQKIMKAYLWKLHNSIESASFNVQDVPDV